MARTISKAFEDFHTRLTPSTAETSALSSHRTSINACLKSNYGMTNFFRTGSIGNGTSIKGHSDTDRFAVIPSGNLSSNSATSLRQIKETLRVRFPTTGVYVDSPAVICPFGNRASQTTEIVPAYHLTPSNGFNVYGIPNMNGGWMKSSPAAHNSYVSGANSKKGIAKKVKPLIRFVKAWKCYRNVPINSFYLELRVTKYALSEPSILYQIDIKNVFKMLIDINLASMQDPMGVSGLISACNTEAKRLDAMSKLRTAYTRAENAWDYEQKGNVQQAFYWWNMLYDQNFPSYY